MPEEQEHGTSGVEIAALAVAAAAMAQSMAQAPRSVVLIVENLTKLTLNKTGDHHDHGGWATPPDIQISPQKADVYGSQSLGGAIGTGTQGNVTYSGDGLTLNVSWDNPFIGSNSCDASISGPSSCRYNVIHECGSGNTGAGMKYILTEGGSLKQALGNQNINPPANIRQVASNFGLTAPISVCQLITTLRTFVPEPPFE